MSEDWDGGLRLVAQAKVEILAASEVQKVIVSLTEKGEGEVTQEIANAISESDKQLFLKRRDEADDLCFDLDKYAPKSKAMIDDLRLINAALEKMTDFSYPAAALQKLDIIHARLMSLKKLADDRKQIELRLKDLKLSLTSLTSKCQEAQNELDNATNLLDEDNNGKARDCLDKAELLIDEKAVYTGIEGELNEQFTKAVARMAGTEKGQKLLDQLVESSGSKATKPETLVFLCESRFNLFSVDDKDFGEVDSRKAITSIYKALAKVPSKFVRTNQSVRGIKLTLPDKAGASYESKTTTMKGRPGAMKKKFGTGCSLPGDIEEDFKPANEEEIDQFESSNVHETGHAVDDQLGFMRSKIGNSEYGSWKEHGGGLDEIADAVVGKFGKPFANVLKPWCIDLMTGHTADKPELETKNQEEFKKACEDIKRWHDNAKLDAAPWYNQKKCDAITINATIYQESYKGKWTSYPAAERRKGITSYQFRSPVEWFAELFAAYLQKKLKPSHPACKWLSEL